ncbi:hypothetical protein GJ744_009906 [Endocarpon pusillum]|uniref:Uncharacterized protein n=1 Tax=Endocarpon pusillum TaxID=364733 RepID=A0A8H7AIG2_9EURO|nr:hypothetical protein GJ744_009906 [Endocarpon pusillum]
MHAQAVARRSPQCLNIKDSFVGLISRYSTAVPSRNANPISISRPIDPRWLSDTKQRVGKCITFGLSSTQLEEASSILRQLASDWTELLVGSEGYLTAPGRVGLEKQAVVWGEMDTMGM